MADQGLYTLLIDLKADTAQLQRGMDQAVGILQRSGSLMQNALQGAFQGVGQAITRDLLGGIKNLSSALGDLADKGEVAGSIADAFKKLGGSSDSITKAQKALLGTASAFDLMKAANEGLLKGIPNLNANFAKMADFAGRFADQSGRDTVEVLDQLTQAIGSGSTKALREFGIEIDGTGTHAQKMQQALDGMASQMERLAPMSDSAANAQAAFNTALDDATTTVGIAINNSGELTGAYRELEGVVKSIDWDSVGRGVASLAANFISLANSILPSIKNIEQFAIGLEVALGTSARAKFLNLKTEADDLKKSIADLEGSLASRPAGSGLAGMVGLDSRQASLDAARARLNQIPAEAAPYYDQMNADRKGSSGAAATPAVAPVKAAVDQVNSYARAAGSRTNAANAADRVSKEESAQERLAQQQSDAAGRQMRDLTDVQELAYSRGVSTWESLFGQAINAVGGNLNQQLTRSATDFASQLAQAVFGGTGAQGNGQSLGSQIGQGIASYFGNNDSSLTTNEAHAQGVQGPGRASGLFSAASGLFAGAGLSTDQAHAQGIEGPGLPGGSFGGASGASSASSQEGAQAILATVAQQIANLQQRDAVDKRTGSNAGTGQAVGGGVGAGLGAIYGGPVGAQMGSQIGSVVGYLGGSLLGRGAKNPETQARHAIANFLEDALKEKGPMTFTHKDGSRYQFDGNLVVGDTNKFKTTDWGADFAKQAGSAKGTFAGLGEVLKKLAGQTKDVGDQMGYILGENLEFNVDNARVLVRKLGLNFEDMEKQLVDVGLKGKKTWLEIEGDIQGVADAAKPGLVAVGAFGEAFKRMQESGARGFEAVDNLRSIGVEAAEANIHTFEQLRMQLLKTYDPATVDKFFAALRQRGVTTVEQLSGLSDRQAGGVIADMQALGVKFTDVGKHIADSADANAKSVDSNTDAINNLTSAINDKLGDLGKALEGPAPDDAAAGDDTTAFARGGVVHGPTRALMGEAGPEAILPLSRKNGRLGVAVHGMVGGGGSGGASITIDARGATPGVAKEIRRAMLSAEDRAVARVMRSLAQNSRRTT